MDGKPPWWHEQALWVQCKAEIGKSLSETGGGDGSSASSREQARTFRTYIFHVHFEFC
jgi:hypothetical protein